MMSYEQRIETENTEIKNAHFSQKYAASAFCASCEKRVNLMFFDEAAKSFNTVIGDIASMSETGKLHRVQNGMGEILICRESLNREFSQRQTQKLSTNLLPRFI